MSSAAAEERPRDFIVVGSGAGGLTGAIFAAKAGLDVLLVEKSEYFGGTAALSGGNVWIPNNHHMSAAGLADDDVQALKYIERVIGSGMRRDSVAAYLAGAREMLSFVESSTEVRFKIIGDPDYFPEFEGAARLGRGLLPHAYDGRRLGEDFKRLRAPLKELTAFGGMMFEAEDLPHLLGATKSLRSFRHSCRLIGRYMRDRLQYSRGTNLTFGNALAGGLLKAARDAGVTLWNRTAATALQVSGGRISSLTVTRDGRSYTIPTKRGVLLACGGFAHHPRLKRMLEFADDHLSMQVESDTGDGIQMALLRGASLGSGTWHNAIGYPVTRMRRPDGSWQKMMLLLGERFRPGTVIVNRSGKRFFNEAAPYNDFYHAQVTSAAVPAYLICDHRALRAYGLGLLRPGPALMRPLTRFLKSGYIVRAPTLEDLARKLGIDARGLESTVKRMNEAARLGIDTEFGRGQSYYDRFNGDAGSAHPNLGPIQSSPFYAVEVYPGSTGTFCGLITNGNSQVLDEDGAALPGLYACGLDMHSPFCGYLPGPGCSIGPGMTFGFLAARHAAQSVQERSGSLSTV